MINFYKSLIGSPEKTPDSSKNNEVGNKAPDAGICRRRFLAVLGGTLAGMATGCSALKYGDDEVGTDAGPRSSNSGWGEEGQCLDLEAMAGRPDVPIGRVIDEDGEIRNGFSTKPCKDDWMPDASVPETDGGMPDARTPPDAAEVPPAIVSGLFIDCSEAGPEPGTCAAGGFFYPIRGIAENVKSYTATLEILYGKEEEKGEIINDVIVSGLFSAYLKTGNVGNMEIKVRFDYVDSSDQAQVGYSNIVYIK